MINLLNEFARIPVCGAISSYNTESEEEDIRVQPKLIKTKALMQGFIVGDYADRFSEGAKQLVMAQGRKLHYEETITEGFSYIPDAFLLFKGENKGKQIIKVSDLS